MSDELRPGAEPEGTSGFLFLLGIGVVPILITLTIAYVATR